jgi:methylthioribulose-1-phosphate dehydratase
MNPEEAARQIADLSRRFYNKGWCLATSGNSSVRAGSRIFITASARDKGRLKESDVTTIDSIEASAEAEIHHAIYDTFPQIGCVLHVHSPFATVISLVSEDAIELKDYEMLKAISGVTTHEHPQVVPIFKNSQDVRAIAKETITYLKLHPDVHAFLLKGHGLYTWGSDLAEAERHVEAFEFLFECEYRRRILI